MDTGTRRCTGTPASCHPPLMASVCKVAPPSRTLSSLASPGVWGRDRLTFDTVPVTVIVKETSVCVLVCSCRQLCPLGLSCTTGQEPLACSWSVSGIFLARAESNCLADPRARVPQRLPAPGLISPLRPLLTLGQRFSKAHGTKCGYPKRGLTSSFPTQGALPRPAGHGCGETERDGQAGAFRHHWGGGWERPSHVRCSVLQTGDKASSSTCRQGGQSSTHRRFTWMPSKEELPSR